MRLFKTAGILTLMFIAARATIASADAPPAHTVTTAGQAIIYVVPDEVIVNFGVENFDADLDKAKTANDEMSTKLLKAIKALGIEEKHIQTDTVQVSVEYKDNRPWEGFRGYVTRRSYSVNLKDTRLFEKLVDAALKNGANQIYGFEFRTTELRKYRDQARAMAIKAAKEKAVALARELECGVGKPWQISEGSNGYWGNSNFNSMAQNVAQAVPGGGGDGESTLPLGQIAVRADVNVVFDLTDK